MKKLFGKTKNRTWILSLLLIAGVLTMTSTMALLSKASNVLTNKLELGSLATEIYEVTGSSTQVGDNRKEVRVDNVGKSDAFIRARITVSPEALLTSGKVRLYCNGSELIGDPSDDSAVPGRWIYADGYYYYSQAVPGKENPANTSPYYTDNLITNVNLSGDLSSEDAIEVTVYQESVSSYGYTNDLSNIQNAFAQAD